MHLLASVASAAYTLRAPPPRLCADVALQPQILAFTPSLPCIDAASPIERVLSAPGVTSPAWLPRLDALALVDGRGATLLLRPGAADATALAGGPWASHAALGGTELAAVGAAGVFAVDAEEPAAPRPLAPGAAGAGARVHALADRSLLVADASARGGSLWWVPPEDDGGAAVPLLEGCGPVGGLCVGQGERDVYLSVGADVWRASFDQLTADGAPPSCGTAERVATLDTSPTGAVAVDANGNLYVGDADGVLVLDEGGEPLVRVPLPAPASGVAFGGGGYGTLYASGGDGVWAVKANIAGAAVPSDALLKQLEKLDNAGAFRHTGW